MTQQLSLRVEGRYASIENLVWDDIPPLAVLTGLNGSGKSQLLELIAHYHGVLELQPARRGTPTQPAIVSFIGEDFLPGEVFHSYGEWPALTSAPASEDQVREA